MRNIKNIVIILLAAALMLSLYFIFSQDRQKNTSTTEENQSLLKMNQECKIASENEKDEYESGGVFFIETDYIFSEDLDTCLFYGYSLDLFGKEKVVTDLFTGKYIVYYYESSSGEENTQVFCGEGVDCVSEEVFDSRKKELFKE